MKDIKTYINESFVDNVKNKIKSTLNKIMHSSDYKEWKKNNIFLSKFIERKDVQDHIDKFFNFNDKDSFIELFEYGIVEYLPYYTEDNDSSIDTIIQFIKDDKDWQLFKSDNNFAWYIPGIQELLMVDIDDMYKYEKDIISIHKEFYKYK